MGFSSRMVASRVEERIEDMPAQGKEKTNHVLMKVWTNQRNEGVRKMQ